MFLLNVFLRCCWVLHVEDKQVAYDEQGVEAEERGHRETGPEPVFDVADLLGQRSVEVEGDVDALDADHEYEAF